MSRHPLASAFAEVSVARLAYRAGDREDCLATLTSIARDVAAYRPQGRDEVQSHRRVTRLLDRLSTRIAKGR